MDSPVPTQLISSREQWSMPSHTNRKSRHSSAHAKLPLQSGVEEERQHTAVSGLRWRKFFFLLKSQNRPAMSSGQTHEIPSAKS